MIPMTAILQRGRRENEQERVSEEVRREEQKLPIWHSRSRHDHLPRVHSVPPRGEDARHGHEDADPDRPFHLRRA